MATFAPTPSTYRETTTAPTPHLYSSQTLVPTPTQYLLDTFAPTPTTYTATTHAPTPTSYRETTRQPTVSHFPTSSPTVQDAWILTTAETIILFVTVFVIIVAFILYWRHSGTPKKPASELSTEPSEDTPFIDSKANSSSTPQNAFESLATGVILNLHTAKGSKQVKMTLQDSELRWESLSIMTRKRYKLDLLDVLFVEWGKQTHNFRKGDGSTADEQQCLSLVSQSTTLDMEASSKAERDALAEGFTKLIEKLKAQKSAT